MQSLLNRTEIDLNHVHDKWMIQLAKDIKLSLHVVLIPWLQGNRLHGKSNFRIIPLLHKFQNPILARTKAVTDCEKLLHLLSLEDSLHSTKQLGVHIMVCHILVIEAIELG